MKQYNIQDDLSVLTNKKKKLVVSAWKKKKKSTNEIKNSRNNDNSDKEIEIRRRRDKKYNKWAEINFNGKSVTRGSKTWMNEWNLPPLFLPSQFLSLSFLYQRDMYIMQCKYRLVHKITGNLARKSKSVYIHIHTQFVQWGTRLVFT